MTVVVVPALLLGLLEGGLRIAGYGHRLGFLIKAGDFYQSNPRFGWRFFPRDISRAPLPIHLSIDKPAGTYRIVVVGGSAAMGYPDEAFSFSRYLEAMLRDSYPAIRFELANAAMTAANSHMMVPAARDCAKLKPDLLIIYMGNNEVVGPYGPGTVFAGPSASLPVIRMGLWVKAARVGQLVSNTVGVVSGGKGSAEWRGMTMFMENLVPADDARLADTYRHFRRNLQDICRAGADVGAGVIICTVPVDVRHCAPFASTHRDGLGAEDLMRWQGAYEQGVTQERAGLYEQALKHFAEAMALDDRSADLHFRLGRCYVELGKPGEAFEHFRQARELDALRFRADATINDTIRQVARDSDGQVTLVDAERAFGTLADVAGSPGEELFLDHVHPNYRGSYELARSVFQAVMTQLPAGAGGDGNVEAPTFERCNDLLALTHSDRLRHAASLWQLTRGPPFTNQLNYKDVRGRMLARREALWAKTVPEADMLATYDSASAAAPQDATLHIFAATIHGKRRNFPVVAQHLAEAKRLRPNEAQIYFLEATMYLDQGDLPEAERAVGAYLDLLDHSLPSYIAAVNLFGAFGNPVNAEAYARQVVRRMPEHAAALTLLAKIIKYRLRVDQAEYRQGLAEAENLLTQAIGLQPEYPNAWLQLGEAQRATGRLSEASASFRRAVELDPSLSGAYVGMGMMLFRQGHVQQAKAWLARAVELSPDDLSTTAKYAELLCMDGSIRQAAALLRRALRISPDLPPITGKLAWVLATSADPQLRNGPEAVRLAESALAKSEGRPSTMLVLAAAYAADGQFPKAIAMANQALDRAHVIGNAALANRLEDHLARYGRAQALSLDSYDRLEGW